MRSEVRFDSHMQEETVKPYTLAFCSGRLEIRYSEEIAMLIINKLERDESGGTVPKSSKLN